MRNLTDLKQRKTKLDLCFRNIIQLHLTYIAWFVLALAYLSTFPRGSLLPLSLVYAVHY